MKVIRKVTKIAIYILILLPIYHLSSLFNKHKNIWVIGYKKGFLDNSKYFYLQNVRYLKEKYDIDLIWIAKEESSYDKAFRLNLGKVYKSRSLYGLISLLKAKVYISSNAAGDDLPFFLSKKAITVYLWHGIGIKNMKYKDERESVQKILKSKLLRTIYPSIFIEPDIMLSTSTHMSFHFSECFRIPKDNCFISNYPRCSILNIATTEIVDFLKSYNDIETLSLLTTLECFNKTYLYMPTWRDNEPSFLQRNIFEWDKLDKLLSIKNEVLILKIHPYSITPDFSKFTNIIVLDSNIDIYPILPFTDMLITDYSSIYFDYILMKHKPIILFPFDYQQYIDECRDFAYDYNKHMPGLRINNLIDIIDLQNLQSANAIEAQDFIRSLYWEDLKDDKYYLAEKIMKKIDFF